MQLHIGILYCIYSIHIAPFTEQTTPECSQHESHKENTELLKNHTTAINFLTSCTAPFPLASTELRRSTNCLIIIIRTLKIITVLLAT